MTNLRPAIFSLKLSLGRFARYLGWSPAKLSKAINNKIRLSFEDEVLIINQLNAMLPRRFRRFGRKFTYQQIFMRPIPEGIRKYFKEEKDGKK